MNILKPKAIAVDGDGMDKVMESVDRFAANVADQVASEVDIGKFEFIPASKLCTTEQDQISQKREVIKKRIETCRGEIEEREMEIAALREDIKQFELSDKALLAADNVLSHINDGSEKVVKIASKKDEKESG